MQLDLAGDEEVAGDAKNFAKMLDKTGKSE
jgi:hypothetical protein